MLPRLEPTFKQAANGQAELVRMSVASNEDRGNAIDVLRRSATFLQNAEAGDIDRFLQSLKSDEHDACMTSASCVVYAFSRKEGKSGPTDSSTFLSSASTALPSRTGGAGDEASLAILIEEMLAHNASKVLCGVNAELLSVRSSLCDQILELKTTLLQELSQQERTSSKERSSSPPGNAAVGAPQAGCCQSESEGGRARVNITTPAKAPDKPSRPAGASRFANVFNTPYKHYDESSPEMHYDTNLGKDSKLGEGTFGSVQVGHHRDSKVNHAIKTIKRSSSVDADIWKEVEVLKQLSHPNVLTLHATYEDSLHIYIVTEICAGGELFDAIANKKGGGMTERMAAKLMQQMVKSINYIHCCRICHRDIKPENFLLSHKDYGEDAQIKLIDFGAAKSFADDAILTTRICTIQYAAPEVLSRSAKPYTERVDIWSIGIIMYILLSGQQPFSGGSDIETIKLIKKGKISFTPRNIWSNISADAVELLQHMLTVNPAQRIDSQQALDQRWIAKLAPDASDMELVPEDVFKLVATKVTTKNNKLDRLVQEAVLGTSCFEEEDEGEHVRIVNLCLLRIVVRGSGLILVRRSTINDQTDTVNQHNDLPGHKIFPRETCWSAAQRIMIDDLGPIAQTLRFNDDTPMESLVDEGVSKTFGGLRTRYIKTILELYTEVDDVVADTVAAVLLPDPQPGSTFSLETAHGALVNYEWMSKESCTKQGIRYRGIVVH